MPWPEILVCGIGIELMKQKLYEILTLKFALKYFICRSVVRYSKNTFSTEDNLKC